MPKKPGNPDFGKKWKAEPVGEEPLKARSEVRMTTETKQELAILAKAQNKSISEVIRDAIIYYLANQPVS